MSGARISLFALIALFASACAGARKAESRAAEVTAQPAEKPAEGARQAYERILGSFSVEPEAVLLLDPVMCARHCDGDVPADGLAQIADRFASIGAARGEAVARLNLGAVQWYRGDAEASYREMMRALNVFAELGDVDGLAHAYEWLGFFLVESGAPERAGEHLATSYQLYRMLENKSAAERVLGYGE